MELVPEKNEGPRKESKHTNSGNLLVLPEHHKAKTSHGSPPVIITDIIECHVQGVLVGGPKVRKADGVLATITRNRVLVSTEIQSGYQPRFRLVREKGVEGGGWRVEVGGWRVEGGGWREVGTKPA